MATVEELQKQARIKLLQKQAQESQAAPGGAIGPRPGITAAQMLAPETDEGMSWGEVGTTAIEQAVPSAIQLAEDVTYPIRHPIKTAEAVGNLALGTAQKFIPGEQRQEQYADAFNQFWIDRYGGWENVKETMANDPAGFLADVAGLLTLGVGTAARAPGVVGRAGRAAQRISPTRATGRLAAEALALPTGASGDAIRTAARAGEKGGAASEAFKRTMRGVDEISDVAFDAKAALDNIRTTRGATYRSGMADVAKTTKPIDFATIDKAIDSAVPVKQYKGVEISKSTAKVRKKINKALDEWRALDPTEYHTPEGIDALKQQIGDIRDSTKFGTPARKVADQAYHAVRNRIIAADPKYGKVMKAYEDASKLIKEIEKTLSQTPNASIDTQVRKLQSTLRNNVNTSYGQRKALADLLVENGATNLMEKLAGQMLSEWMPRGITRSVLAGASTLDPTTALTAPLYSPRLVGEAAHAAGQAARVLPRGAASMAIQTGRGAGLMDEEDERGYGLLGGS